MSDRTVIEMIVDRIEYHKRDPTQIEYVHGHWIQANGERRDSFCSRYHFWDRDPEVGEIVTLIGTRDANGEERHRQHTTEPFRRGTPTPEDKPEASVFKAFWKDAHDVVLPRCELQKCALLTRCEFPRRCHGLARVRKDLALLREILEAAT